MRSRPAAGLALLLALVALSGAARANAQLTLTADATRATVHYDGYLRSGVWLLSPVVRFEQPRLTLAARGNFSLFQSGNRSTDLVLAASAYPVSRRAWRGEISGTGGVSRYLMNNTAYGTFALRAHRISRSAAGIWLGAAATGVTGSTVVIGGARGEAGAWARGGPLTASVVASLSSVAQTRFADLGVQARYTRGWLELAGGAGTRGGAETLGQRVWGDLSATVWMTRRLALVAGHGAYPSDPSQLSPGGEYTALSMRIATRPSALRDALTRTIGYPAPTMVRPVVAGFEVERRRDGRARIRIRAADARTVELMGNFTDWTPVALERMRGDRWEVTLPLERGTHQVMVRVNGEAWGIPPGIGTASDDFGGVVGVLVIS